MPTFDSNSEDVNKNAPYRSSRRAAHKGRVPRVRKQRRLTVRSELREEPDIRKIARAIIQMAMAQAEREAQAQAQAEREQGGESGSTDE